MANALAKAAKIAEQLDEGIVIGADTVVVGDGKNFAKAGDPSEAEEMLMALRGSIHQVFSGIAVVDAKTGKKESDVVETHVKILPVSDDEIKRYVATGEPIGKAGGYAIQGLGAILIEEVHGCFYNVVGLPLSRLYGLLNRFEVNLLGLE